jgi:hypothetical protein
MVMELEKVREKLGRAVEVIFIMPRGHERHFERLVTNAKLVQTKRDFHATLDNAIQKASGTFVFFSGGNAVPLSSFVHYLGEEVYSGRVTEELLYGDTYFINRSLTQVQSTRSYSQMELEFEKDYCCNHLAFVVRKDALSAAIRRTESKIRALSDIAELLFTTCNKRRLYRSICMTIAYLRPHGTPYSEIMLMRLKNNVKHGKAIVSFIDKLGLRSLTLCFYDRYLNNLLWARTTVHGIIKPFRKEGSPSE